MDYKYWEKFIATWSKRKIMKGWTDPCPPILLNGPSFIDKTTDYIPEPWWGNDGTQPLHSVVINFNPGAGGCCQKRGVVPYVSSYAGDIVNNMSILSQTRNWHWVHRAKPLLDELNSLGIISSGYTLKNHLSIELLPWHTSNVDKAYMLYISDNIKEVYDNVICFAANESRRIKNSKLKNVVIMRMNDQKAKLVFEEIKKATGYSWHSERSYTTTSGQGKCEEFTISSLSDIRFICIWGPTSRNDFPPKKDMNDIMRWI